MQQIYDFMDFGAGNGGCMEFATKRLGGKRGLGIEILKHRSEKLQSMGYDCVNDDICTINLPKKSVRFVTISHVLEHLPDLEQVKSVVKKAVNTATDFVFIEGPTFDFDTYLEKHNLKFYWRDWSNHPSKVTTYFLESLAQKMGVPCEVLVEYPLITSAYSQDLIPLKSKSTVKCVDNTEKKNIMFDVPIFRSFIFLMWLKDTPENAAVRRARSKFNPLRAT